MPVVPLNITGVPLNFATWRYPMTCFTGVPGKGEASQLSQDGLERALDNTFLVMQDIPQLGMHMRPRSAVNVWLAQMEEHCAPWIPQMNKVCSP